MKAWRIYFALISVSILSHLYFTNQAMANTSTFEAALKTHVNAIAQRDWPAFASTLTSAKTLTFIQPSGKLSTSTEDFKKQMQAWFADKDWSWSLEPLSSEVTTNTGIAIYRVTYNDVDPQGKPVVLKYVVTLVFAKEVAGWKLVHDQNTMLAK